MGLLHDAPGGVRQNRFRRLVCYLGQRSDTNQGEGQVATHRVLLVMVEDGGRVIRTPKYLSPGDSQSAEMLTNSSEPTNPVNAVVRWWRAPDLDGTRLRLPSPAPDHRLRFPAVS